MLNRFLCFIGFHKWFRQYSSPHSYLRICENCGRSEINTPHNYDYFDILGVCCVIEGWQHYKDYCISNQFNPRLKNLKVN